MLQTEYQIIDQGKVKFTGTLAMCQESLIGIYGGNVTIAELALRGVIIEPINQ